MSNIRQPAPLDELVIRAVPIGFSSGYHWRLQGGEWGVLVWASRGIITVTVDASLWVVPPHQAVWVPAQTTHSVRMAGRGTLRQVYVAPSRCPLFPFAPRVVDVGPLLRELLRRICALGTLAYANHTQRRLFELVLDELVAPRVEPVALPMPTDARAVRATERVRAAPAASHDAALVARDAHASVRTLERLFRAETGMTFGTWRQRARLVHAMTLLADGMTVTAVSSAVGYASTSAFVAAFRVSLGLTPGQYAASTSKPMR